MCVACRMRQAIVFIIFVMRLVIMFINFTMRHRARASEVCVHEVRLLRRRKETAGGIRIRMEDDDYIYIYITFIMRQDIYNLYNAAGYTVHNLYNAAGYNVYTCL